MSYPLPQDVRVILAACRRKHHKQNNNNRRTMANYDSPGLTYDSGVFYDAVSAPQQKTVYMTKVKLGLDKLSPDEVVSLAGQIKTAMTSNANFTTPNPPLPTMGTAIATATVKVATQKAAAQAALQAITDRDAAIEELKALLTSEASYVENIALGDAVKIQSAGMSVKAPRTPVGPLTPVTSLSVTAGDDAGELDVTWDPVRGAKSYQVQISSDPMTPESWRDVSPAASSRKRISGQTSGTRVWVRVRAIAPKEANNGAWSDVATKIVP